MEIMIEQIDMVTALSSSLLKLGVFLALIILLSTVILAYVKQIRKLDWCKSGAKPNKYQSHHGGGTKPKPDTPKPEGVRPPLTSVGVSRAVAAVNDLSDLVRAIRKEYGGVGPNRGAIDRIVDMAERISKRHGIKREEQENHNG